MTGNISIYKYSYFKLVPLPLNGLSFFKLLDNILLCNCIALGFFLVISLGNNPRKEIPFSESISL